MYSSDIERSILWQKKQVYTGRRSKKEQPQNAGVLIAKSMTMAKKKDIPVICQRIRYYHEKMP